MLYGMADPIKDALVQTNQRVRVYTPYGELLPGMAYLVRRLLENTSNESFLRAGFLENLPEEQLLMNPLEVLRRRRSQRAGGNGHAGLPASAGSRAAEFRNEALSDFSREVPRDSMRRELEQVRGALGATSP